MKDNDKILIAKSLLKVTFIMICVSLFLKLLGLNIMQADGNNKILLYITDTLKNNKYVDIVYLTIFLLIQSFIFCRLSCKNKNIKTYFFTSALITIITLFAQWYIYYNLSVSVSETIYFVFSITILLIGTFLIDINIKEKINSKKNLLTKLFIQIWKRIKKPLLIFLIVNIYQLIVMFLRNITYIQTYDRLYDFLLNFDYIILLLVTYFLFLKRETGIKFSYTFNFSLPRILDEKPSIESIRVTLSDIKEERKEFKSLAKEEKVVRVIYIILFTLSELFNLALIVFIASLNHAIIECLFVVSAFLITRKIFGAFHFDSAWKCWIVSNISFFILNKITLSAGFTIVIPILLGIGLAFITSKFIKKHTTTPYRGMAAQELKYICKNKQLSKFELNLLIDFYCNKESIIKLTYKYNYSRAAIFLHKSNALKKLAI